ncbi:MAG: hypothetical protein WBG02_01805 [Candidatus Acidiferrum sp.]
MIQVTSTGLHVSVSGAVVYLDNWAVIDLAKKDSSRRRRFIDIVHSGVDVLFSVTNAAELSGPQGRSADAVRVFLDEIGPRWFPARHDVTEVIKDEMRGVRPEKACIDENFFKSHVADQMRRHAASGGKVMEVSGSFFRLGPVLDRVGPQRESISRTSAEFDRLLKTKMSAIHERCKGDSALLDQKFPLIPFDPGRPACFVYFNLLRTMAVEAHSLKKGDGMDFCHAVIASAFSSFAALDTQWKRRIASLPPNRLARIYAPLELNQMVTDMELWLRHRVAG